MESNTELKNTLWKKIENVRVGMFTSIDEEGKLQSRPMTNQQVDAEGLLWFFVSDQAALAKQITKKPSVNVSFSQPSDSLYVSVAGDAELVQDKEVINDKWNPIVGAWFPDGVDDPHVALIKVRISSAEYWDSDKSQMTQLFLMAKAAITKTPPKLGEHKTITI
jgi:general stress protein 26